MIDRTKVWLGAWRKPDDATVARLIRETGAYAVQLWEPWDKLKLNPGPPHFVPLIHGKKLPDGTRAHCNLDDLRAGALAAVQNPIKVLMGWNEPDHTGENQGNMTPEEAYDLYVKAKSQHAQWWQPGLCIGSPATKMSGTFGAGKWLPRYQQLGGKWDVTCVHAYPPTLDTEELRVFLKRTWDEYGKPIIVSEMAPIDWSSDEYHTPAEVARWLPEAYQVVSEDRNVLGAMWFALGDNGQGKFAATRLYDDSLRITPVGEAFRRAAA